MAIGGIDSQSGTASSVLRNVAQQNQQDQQRADETREAREARAGNASTSSTQEAQERAGIGTGPATQGGGVPGSTLASQSLNALIQATQEQDDEPTPAQTSEQDAAEEADDQAVQNELVAGNSTNSLAPGAANGATGTTDTRGVSFLI